MKIGVVTYVSLHSNFTNYGTVLQAWALCQAIKRINAEYDPVLVNYCPDSMADKNPLNPIDNMWDTDPEIRKQCEDILPDIKDNFEKIVRFYNQQFTMTEKEYSSQSFDKIADEDIARFVVGSDSIWDEKEFGYDRVYWADTPLMKDASIAYAPSFQDSFHDMDRAKIEHSLRNFKSISVRDVEPAARLKTSGANLVLDPTLLLSAKDYDLLIKQKECDMPKKYLLLYSRRYNHDMEKTAYNIAREKHLRVVEISIRSSNRDRSIFRYDAGVEEFLNLIKNAEFVITNSYHCILFSVQYKKKFLCFTREHCNDKITDFLKCTGMKNRLSNGTGALDNIEEDIDYDTVYERLVGQKEYSYHYLKEALEELE